MIDTPKRRFWQIHLSTAVVLMLVSGAFLGANCLERVTERYDETQQAQLNYAFRMRQTVGEYPTSHTFVCVTNGWPLQFSGRIVDEAGNVMPFYAWGNEWRNDWLVLNVLLGIALCVVTATICERLIRREAANHEA